MYSPKEIGLRIKTRRAELNMTLDEIALFVGVSKSTIQRYENGLISRVKMPVVQSIADALRVAPDWLVGITAEKTIPAKDNGLNTEELELLSIYRSVNEDGRQYIVKQAKFAAEQKEFRLPPAPAASAG